MNWYKTAKFMNPMSPGSAVCGHCSTPLKPVGISVSDRHHFPIGQEWSCSCGKSKIWTNSIRDHEALIKHFEEGTPYYQGICNDKRCGYTGDWIVPLENGVEVPWTNQRMDRYGSRAEENQNIIMDISKELPENGDQPIIDWYRSRKDEIKRLMLNI